MPPISQAVHPMLDYLITDNLTWTKNYYFVYNCLCVHVQLTHTYSFIQKIDFSTIQ